MFKKSSLMAAAAGVALMVAGAAHADSTDFTPEKKGTFIVTLRVTDVAPANDAPILNASGAATGLKAHVDSDVMPTLGFTYFLTDHIAAEAILGSTEHRVSAFGPGTNLPVRDEWVLPPVVSLHYHLLPNARFNPYVGGGVNYMMFFAGQDYSGFHTHLKDGFGGVVQWGADYAVTGPWALNLDVKKIFFSTTATVNDGALVSHVPLDPWVFSAGISRKF